MSPFWHARTTTNVLESATWPDVSSSRSRAADYGSGVSGGEGPEGVDRLFDGVATSTRQRPRPRALAFARGFYPGLPLWIVARLEASTTVGILAAVDDEVLSRPDEYHGYVIRYAFPTQVYGFLFSKAFLERGGRHRLTGDVNYFSVELNLVATALESLGD